MCYWFERSGDYIRCEVRHVGNHYELVVLNPDGTETVQRFADSERLYGHQVALEQTLLDGGWKGPHGRIV